MVAEEEEKDGERERGGEGGMSKLGMEGRVRSWMRERVVVYGEEGDGEEEAEAEGRATGGRDGPRGKALLGGGGSEAPGARGACGSGDGAAAVRNVSRQASGGYRLD